MADGGWRMADGSEGMSPEAMIQRTRDFANRVSKLCQALPSGPESQNVRRQLGRCSSSVAANYRAAQRARSKAEFRAKLGIVEEEADESIHWLRTVIDQEMLTKSRVEPLLDEANQLTAIVVSAIRSAKSRKTGPTKEPSAIRHPPSAIFKVGHGFDLHRLEAGLPLIVAGVSLEHDLGCVAHSDGDVVYHAVTDALLGALALGDIGTLFPDDDPRWKGADSRVFVEEAVRRVEDAGYVVGNVDVTVVLERPKLRPHIDTMRANLAGLLGVEVSAVSVKGKTHEKVDAVGRGDAIACHVVAMLM